MAQNRHPRLAYFGQVMAISDQNHPGHAARGSGINADDLAMRDRAAPVHDMGHAGHFNVAEDDVHRFAAENAQAIEAIGEKAKGQGIALVRTPAGFGFAPTAMNRRPSGPATTCLSTPAPTRR